MKLSFDKLRRNGTEVEGEEKEKEDQQQVEEEENEKDILDKEVESWNEHLDICST